MAPSARTGSSLRISCQRRSAPMRASVCSSTTEPRRRATSSAVYVRSIPLQRWSLRHSSASCVASSWIRASCDIWAPSATRCGFGSRTYHSGALLHLCSRNHTMFGIQKGCVLRAGQAVVAEDDLGDTDGLLAALPLHARSHRDLAPPVVLLDCVDVESAAHARAGGDGRREPDPVEAVVERHAVLLVRDHLVRHRRQERKRQIAVRDRSAEGGRRRPLGIHVDELMVPGRVGKRLDPLLLDLDPRRGAELGADLDWARHARNATRPDRLSRRRWHGLVSWPWLELNVGLW